MFMALGVGHPEAAVFHLFTHAFFKAMLFLGSGSVIHGMHEAEHSTHGHLDCQDMQNMGGLLKKMPVTGVTFGVGVLSIAGVFPLAGFWSKDSVLHALSESPAFSGVYAIALITAALTAFYMSRQFLLTFTGAARTQEAGMVHESPWVMSLPLVVLMVPSALSGYLGNLWFAKEELSISVATLSTFAVLLGFAVSFALYVLKVPVKGLQTTFAPLLQALENRLYIDQLYEQTVVSGLAGIGVTVAWFDKNLVDGFVNLVSAFFLAGSQVFKYVETGKTQFYLLIVITSVVTLGFLISMAGT
jgi:NAD(P)H-quinone oxidoreductase subunit 5